MNLQNGVISTSFYPFRRGFHRLAGSDPDHFERVTAVRFPALNFNGAVVSKPLPPRFAPDDILYGSFSISRLRLLDIMDRERTIRSRSE